MTRLPAPRASTLWILGQAGLVMLLVFIYFEVRGLTEGSRAHAFAHAHDIETLERWLHIDFEGRLQAPVDHSETVVTIANWVYI
jgi:hypothetical protein